MTQPTPIAVLCWLSLFLILAACSERLFRPVPYATLATEQQAALAEAIKTECKQFSRLELNGADTVYCLSCPPPIADYLCETHAALFEGRTMAELRETFGLQLHLTPTNEVYSLHFLQEDQPSLYSDGRLIYFRKATDSPTLEGVDCRRITIEY